MSYLMPGIAKLTIELPDREVESLMDAAAMIDEATDTLKRSNDEARLAEDYAELLDAVRAMFDDLEAYHGLSRQRLVDLDYKDGGFQIADKHLAFRAMAKVRA